MYIFSAFFYFCALNQLKSRDFAYLTCPISRADFKTAHLTLALFSHIACAHIHIFKSAKKTNPDFFVVLGSLLGFIAFVFIQKPVCVPVCFDFKASIRSGFVLEKIPLKIMRQLMQYCEFKIA